MCPLRGPNQWGEDREIDDVPGWNRHRLDHSLVEEGGRSDLGRVEDLASFDADRNPLYLYWSLLQDQPYLMSFAHLELDAF